MAKTISEDKSLILLGYGMAMCDLQQYSSENEQDTTEILHYLRDCMESFTLLGHEPEQTDDKSLDS